MRLVLFRHGIAINREDPDCPAEAERFLTDKGIQRTLAAARGLKALGVNPQVVLSSPMVRARQTAQIAAQALGFPEKEIQNTGALLWDAPPAALFRELAKLKAEEVLCAGHAPHLDEALAFGLGAAHPFTQLKKAGAACLEITPGPSPGGVLLWLATSRQLRLLG